MKASLIGLVDYGENGSDCDRGGGGDYVDYGSNDDDGDDRDGGGGDGGGGDPHQAC